MEEREGGGGFAHPNAFERQIFVGQTFSGPTGIAVLLFFCTPSSLFCNNVHRGLRKIDVVVEFENIRIVT